MIDVLCMHVISKITIRNGRYVGWLMQERKGGVDIAVMLGMPVKCAAVYYHVYVLLSRWEM